MFSETDYITQVDIDYILKDYISLFLFQGFS